MAKKGIIDFYAALEVGEEADEAAIKRSYRHLVLKWHPDKNPTDREKAEERIRLINSAYGTLSNPTKREKYDLQRFAMDKKHRGVAPAKPKASPKMAVPKEFMMQPLGHPDRFVRHEGRKAFVQARVDVEASFADFFQKTKFSLWWLPEVNNMCRVRALGSKARGDKRGAAAGLAGGLNLSFRVATDAESEVLLAAAEKGKRSETVDFVAKESPEYEGAFRFETACRRGHYLAFRPPSDLRVVPLLNEEAGRVLDFMLVDFSAMLKFKDIGDLLLPIAEPSRGSWLPLAQFREAKEVASYFQKVLQKPVWDAEDFVAYFEGHWIDWEYKADGEVVRLRPTHERLGQVLRSAQSPADAAIAVLGATDEDLRKLPLPGTLRAIQLLGGSADGGQSESPPGSEVERRKLLKALPSALALAAAAAEAVPVAHLLDAAERVPGLIGPSPTIELLDRRKAVVGALLDLIVARLVPPKVGPGADDGAAAGQRLLPADLLRLLRLPGAVVHDVALQKVTQVALEGAGRELQLQVLRRAIALSCDCVAEAATVSALAGLNYADPDDGAAAVAELARAGARAERLAAALRARATFVAAPALASAVLALCDRGATSEALKGIAESLAAKAPLVGVPSEQLLALVLAAAKIPSMGPVLNAVARAVAEGPGHSWEAGDLVRLLLGLARGKEHLQAEVREALLTKLCPVLRPQLADLPVTELVKVTLGISGLGSSPLLEAVAKEVGIRLSDFSQPQLLLITQALAQGLGPQHAVLPEVLAFWAAKLTGAEGACDLAPEQLAKLVLAACPVLQAAEAPRAGPFLEAAGAALLPRAREVPEASARLLLAELAPGGALQAFAGREELRTALTQPRRPAVAATARRACSPSASRSPSPTAGHKKKAKRKKGKAKAKGKAQGEGRATAKSEPAGASAGAAKRAAGQDQAAPQGPRKKKRRKK